MLSELMTGEEAQTERILGRQDSLMPTKKSEDHKISFSFLANHYCDTTKSIRNCFASKAKRFFFKPFC